jgi:DNA mismatch endonuclease (patch repair protein)
MVFSRRRIAVFIDGCFWHGCPDHYVPSQSNRSYWAPKIAANAARDAETTRVLSEAGWTVLRYWTHTSPEEVAAQIESNVRAHRHDFTV